MLLRDVVSLLSTPSLATECRSLPSVQTTTQPPPKSFQQTGTFRVPLQSVLWLDTDLVIFSSQWMTSSWIQRQTDSRWLSDVLGKFSVWHHGLLLQTWEDFMLFTHLYCLRLSLSYLLLACIFRSGQLHRSLMCDVSCLSSWVPRVRCEESPLNQTRMSLLLVL